MGGSGSLLCICWVMGTVRRLGHLSAEKKRVAKGYSSEFWREHRKQQALQGVTVRNMRVGEELFVDYGKTQSFR